MTSASKVRKNGKKSEKMQTMLQNVNKFTKDFCCVAVETLVGVETGGGGGGAQEVKIDLMPPGVPKVSIFLILDLLGGFLWKASEPSKICFF